MNDHIKEAFARMNLWQIRSFILYGSEQYNMDDYPYGEQLEKATEPILNRINSLYSTPREINEATTDITKALTVYEEVYMEIGMKLGARLIYQLLLSENPSSAQLK